MTVKDAFRNINACYKALDNAYDDLTTLMGEHDISEKDDVLEDHIADEWNKALMLLASAHKDISTFGSKCYYIFKLLDK